MAEARRHGLHWLAYDRLVDIVKCRPQAGKTVGTIGTGSDGVCRLITS